MGVRPVDVVLPIDEDSLLSGIVTNKAHTYTHGSVEKEEDEKGGPIFRDIRRYYCKYCGICRSKKSLITSHILTHHAEEVKEKQRDDDKELGKKLNTCEECWASFQKPAHLKQHMQGHSLEIEERSGKTLY